MASALFGSTAIGYGDLFDRKVDDNKIYLSTCNKCIVIDFT